MTLRGQRPLPKRYPHQLNTIGDHIRKRRLELGLLQKEFVHQLGVDKATVSNWERKRTIPALPHMPGIIQFLGYVPVQVDGSIPERLKAYRRVYGLAQRQLADVLGVDESTIRTWETGRNRPSRESWRRIEELLGRQSSGTGRAGDSPRAL